MLCDGGEDRYAVDVAADEERLQVLFDGGVHRPEALGEGGAADAVEAGVGGDDFDDDQP